MEVFFIRRRCSETSGTLAHACVHCNKGYFYRKYENEILLTARWKPATFKPHLWLPLLTPAMVVLSGIVAWIKVNKIHWSWSGIVKVMSYCYLMLLLLCLTPARESEITRYKMYIKSKIYIDLALFICKQIRLEFAY